MLISEAKKLSSQERLAYWLKERETIRLKRKMNEPWPWTDDEILKTYRFCNVRRMDDKVSVWLLNHWYRPNYDHPNMLLAATLARQFNVPETLDAIGFPKKWDPKKCEKICATRAMAGLKNFGAAYMVTGTLGGTKIQQVLHKVANPIFLRQKEVMKDLTSMERIAKVLVGFAGFSDFMAGQVVADLRHACGSIGKGDWADRERWAPIGPGSVRGMSRLLYGNETYRDHTPLLRKDKELFVSNLIKISESLRDRLPLKYTNGLELHDFQNCLCEFDKYERTLWEGRRPKQLYRKPE